MKSPKEKRQFKRQMKSKPTKAETLFKERLIKYDWGFIQQMILGWYILDFVIPEKMLVFEIDGESHKDKMWYDSKRDDFVKKCGFTTVRIPNHAVENWKLGFMSALPNKTVAEFRSGLAKANSLMGAAKKNNRTIIGELKDRFT